MEQDVSPPELNMTLDGRFLPERRVVPWPTRLRPRTVLIAAAGIAVLAFILLLWVAVLLLPVLVLAGLVGWLGLRVRRWALRA